jgi:hypothetical protein
MSIVLYAKNINGPGAELKLVIQDAAGKNQVEIFDSVDRLMEWRLSNIVQKAVVVLFAEKKDELTDLLPVIQLFRQVQIVLVLPDHEPETIKIGYQLEPRLLSFMDSGFLILKTALRRMLGRSENGSGAKAAAPVTKPGRWMP